ncbi:hypothetical protein O6H91_16G068900 [Diphasiastrum complanatum]|uniref:Uncharacterized protein n=1 Tax=Diphasiastrum complanatum TaxID=34168 RepID=A0ACC2BDH6_DIPCM|nr:hypothetical protein O6H91_16G068900 [Diphasiastrum complanatum]
MTMTCSNYHYSLFTSHHAQCVGFSYSLLEKVSLYNIPLHTSINVKPKFSFSIRLKNFRNQLHCTTKAGPCGLLATHPCFLYIQDLWSGNMQQTGNSMHKVRDRSYKM